MGEIDRKRSKDRDTMLEKAFTMYVDGTPIQEIANTLGIHRNSARNYIQEFANNLEPGERVFRQRVSMARLDKIVAHATHLLEYGDIKDSSLSRPQLMHQVIAAIKEQNKISGLHVSLMHVKHDHGTIKDLVLGMAERAQSEGYHDFDSYLADNEEDIEDAEIIEEEQDIRGEQKP
jgi:hypothetical protein